MGRGIFCVIREESGKSALSIKRGFASKRQGDGWKLLFSVVEDESDIAHLCEGMEVLRSDGVVVLCDRSLAATFPEMVLMLNGEGDPGSRGCGPSPNSNAHYLLRASLPGHGIMVQCLRRLGAATPFSSTSCHYHKEQDEVWHILAGKGLVFHRPFGDEGSLWTGTVLRADDTFHAAPGTCHMLATVSSLVTVLEITGIPEPLSSVDHHFVGPPKVSAGVFP